MIDSKGRFLTQSLFLEIGYNEDALFTLKDIDHFHNDKTYISLKSRYLELEDPTEYEFASQYLAGWRHWQKICENKLLKAHIQEWRAELEYKLRAQAVKSLIGQARTGNFQASKWLADRGWETRAAGRPSKEEIEREVKFQAKAEDEFTADIIRLKKNG